MKACEEIAKMKGLHKYCVKSQNSLEVANRQKRDKGKAALKKEEKKTEQKEQQKKLKEENKNLKQQLALAMAVAKQGYQSNVGPKECRYGTKEKCPRDDCKFSHKPAGKTGGANSRADTWC